MFYIIKTANYSVKGLFLLFEQWRKIRFLWIHCNNYKKDLSVFSIKLTVNVKYKFLPMTEFEPQTSGSGRDRSTN